MAASAAGHDNARAPPDRASPAPSILFLQSREPPWSHITPAPSRLSANIFSSAPALSLKAREIASLSLKRIFEQAQLHLHSSPSNASTPVHSDGKLADTIDHTDERGRAVPTAMATTAADPNLDLRMAISAPPSTTYKTFSNTASVGQLTIFYGGTVCVYESVPTEKARAIMLLASRSGDLYSDEANYAEPSRTNRSSPTSIIASASNTPDPPAGRPSKAVSRSQADLPFARKRSLAHLLARRKERIDETMAFSDRHESSGREPPPPKRCCNLSTSSLNNRSLKT